MAGAEADGAAAEPVTHAVASADEAGGSTGEMTEAVVCGSGKEAGVADGIDGRRASATGVSTASAAWAGTSGSTTAAARREAETKSSRAVT